MACLFEQFGNRSRPRFVVTIITQEDVCHRPPHAWCGESPINATSTCFDKSMTSLTVALGRKLTLQFGARIVAGGFSATENLGGCNRGRLVDAHGGRMAGFEFYRKVLWAEIFALAGIAIVTILPIKFGYVVAGKAELSVKAYFGAAILVILLANVAYIVKSPAGIRVKVALIRVAVTAIACDSWIAQ